MHTRTGNFPIGFYVKQLTWKQDLLAVARWATDHGFAFIDLDEDADESARVVTGAGFAIGSADLIGREPFTSADPDTRRTGVQQAIRYIRAATAGGVRIFNICGIPENPALPRADNAERFIASMRELVPVFEDTGSCLAIEGWPGPGAVASTPESYRAVLDGCESPAIGINYDPSHLIATGIDPVRFAQEFAGHVLHTHGKDTEISAEARYQYGIRQPPLAERERFGENHWRYTIPGHGEMRWTAALQALQAAGYGGGISIELEDKHFNGSEAGEKAGLQAGGAFLASV